MYCRISLSVAIQFSPSSF